MKIKGITALGRVAMSVALGSLALVSSGDALAAAQAKPKFTVKTADVVIYGCTPAGITAALEVKKNNKSVLLICREDYIGGMTTNGLGWADTGNHAAIGGLARKFYQDVRAHYVRQGYDVRSQISQSEASVSEDDGMWVFEPHVAEGIFEDWLKASDIKPVRAQKLLLQKSGVQSKDGRISEIRMITGQRYAGKIFIDATYEGDLLAMAGGSYFVGREANSVYKETHNGVARNEDEHQFQKAVDAYVIPGDAKSGLLPRIDPNPIEAFGSGDHRVQAYNYRVCMTRRPEIRQDFRKPANYDPKQYEVLGRYLDAGWRNGTKKFDPIPYGKTDTNNNGAFSSDDIGSNYGYAEGSYAERAKIMKAHRAYQEGLYWFVKYDPRVPADVRETMKDWGLCTDEFKANAAWPREMYIREARRMVSDFVMTENHVMGRLPIDAPIGMGSYTLDSHNVRRYVDSDGHVRNEGGFQVPVPRPYSISYKSIVPKRGEIGNLYVPIALSASHAAYGSIRMEPVFMILGQSSGAGAVLAIDKGKAVQDVPYPALKAVLLNDGQIVDDDSLKTAARQTAAHP